MTKTLLIAAFLNGWVTTSLFAGTPTCSAPLRSTITIDQPRHMLESDNTLFVLTRKQGMFSYDLSDPLNPALLDSYPAEQFDMALSGDTMYCLGENGTIVLLDVSDPADMTPIAEVPATVTPGLEFTRFYDFDIVDSIIYFTFLANQDDQAKLCIGVLDLSDPLSPTYLAEKIHAYMEVLIIDTIECNGDYLYAFGGNFTKQGIELGIFIYDTTVSSLPQVGFLNLPDADDMVLHDQHLYTLGNSTRVYDLNDPLSPLLVSDILNSTDARSIQFVGNDAYISTLDGIYKCDISTPSSPNVIELYNSFNNTQSSVLNGHVLYGANGTVKIEIANLNDCGLVCQADLTGDGLVDFFDVSNFLSLYAAQDNSIDFDGSGTIDFADVSEFLNLYAIGCP